MANSPNNDILTAAFIDDVAIIRIEGRGCFKISPSIKQFIHHILSKKLAKTIQIDMSKCTGMDSTFMGVLAGLACYIKKNADISLKLINLSEKNHKLLVTLGVDRVVEHTLSTESAETIDSKKIELDPINTSNIDKLEAAETTLHAHKALVKINPENFLKFKSVLEFLEQDVESLSQ